MQWFRYPLVLLLSLVLISCGEDATQGGSDPSNSSAHRSWQRHPSFIGLNSIVYSSAIVSDALFLQGAYTIARIDKSPLPAVAFYPDFFVPDSTKNTGVIGNKHFASTFSAYKGIQFISALDPYDEVERVDATLLLENGEVVRPGFSPESGPTPFGVFNNFDELATFVFYTNSQTCSALVIESVPMQDGTNKELIIKSETALPTPCFSTGVYASYATDGTDFYLGLLNDGVYLLNRDGALSKIYEGRVSNLFNVGTNELLMQNDYQLRLSYNKGATWVLKWDKMPSRRYEYFSVAGKLYYFSENRIFSLDVDGPEAISKEIDNTGLEDIVSNITSITEFNGMVYLTTLGGGVFQKKLGDFEVFNTIN